MRTSLRVAAAAGGVAAAVAVGAMAVIGLAGPGSGSGAAAGSAGAAPVADVARHDLAATLAVDGVLERTDSRAVYWQQPPPSPATPPSSSGVAGGGPPGGGNSGGGAAGRMAGGPVGGGGGGSGGGGRVEGGSSSPARRPPGSTPPSPSTSSPPSSTSTSSSTTSTSTSTTSSTSSTTSSTTIPPTSTSSSTSSSSTSSSTTSSSTPCAPEAAGSSTTTSEAPCPTSPVATGVSWTVPAQQQPSEEPGTLTAVAAEGATVEPGGVLFAVDGRPSVLLTGTEPAFRELEAGVDDGADVAQLEENLVALGLAGDDLAVDEHFDADTAAAVEAWQESLGVEPTGRVELGDVVFSPEAATVVATAAAVGDPVAPGDHVLDVAGDTLVATGAIPARRIDDVEEGSPTLVTLADGTTVSGTVRSVATETVRPEEADVTESTVEVTVQLDVTATAAASAAARAGADAGLAITTETREGVLAVPVAAIVDGGDGEPAVLVAESSSSPSSGAARAVPVAAGLSAGGWVEVTDGSLAEGDTVLLPGAEAG